MRNEVRKRRRAAGPQIQTSNLVLSDVSWEGKRTRDASAPFEVEHLHLGRKLELRHVAWERGKGGERNDVRNEGSADWTTPHIEVMPSSVQPVKPF